MKKFLSLLIVFISFVSLLWAKDGQLFGYKNIHFISTSYFDIIFPEESRESAEGLAQKADQIYKEILEDYCTSQELASPFRIPVVITPATDVYNAYFTNGNFNHIVLFDTVTEEDMAVFSDDLTDTFRHELTHAVTINFRSPGLKKFNDIVGDIYSWGPLLGMTSFLKEGASVSQESKGGQGRLNDPYYLQMARQAKINGNFPSYADVTGSRDIFPAGSSAYGFGGPFTAWLQEKYGMQKYADFWYEAINRLHFTYKGAFKTTYGFSIAAAWEDFYKSLYVPPVAGADPLKAGKVYDFFSNSEKNYSSKNSSGFRYTSLTGSSKGFAYIESATSSVYFVAYDEKGNYKKAKKLFTFKNINEISLSNDGNYLAVGYYDVNHFNLKRRIAIYSLSKKKWAYLNENSLSDACVLKENDRYLLVAVKTQGQKQTIVRYNMEEKMSLSKSDYEIPLDKETKVFGLCPVDEKVSMLTFTGGKWSIREYKADKIFTEYFLPLEKAVIRGLSPAFDGENKYIFSWAEKDDLPRLGLMAKDGSFSLQAENISGGIYWPQKIGSEIFYSGYFVKDYKLLRLKKDWPTLENQKTEEIAAEEEAEAVEKEEDNKENSSITYFEYATAPWKKIYYNRGTLIPFTEVPLYSADGTLANSIISPGVSYLTANPWDADFITLGGGWDMAEAAGGFMLQTNGGSTAQTSLFEYSDKISVTFDSSGYKQSANTLNLSSGISLGRISSLIFSEENLLIHGRQTLKKDIEDSEEAFAEKENSYFSDFIGYIENSDNNKYLSIINNVGLAYSTIRKKGPGFFSKGGIKLAAIYKIQAISLAEDSIDMNTYQSLSPQANFRLSRLIPINCAYGFTYNLPLSLSASLTPDDETFAKASMEALLFALEIQKGLSFMPLYFNRIAVTAGYSAKLDYNNDSFEVFKIKERIKDADKDDFEDSVNLSLLLTGALNTGIFASPSSAVTVTFTLAYKPHVAEGKSRMAFGLGLSSLLNSLK